ncbi:MAG: FTR1 family protein, partial [Acidobacteriota bacterium]
VAARTAGATGTGAFWGVFAFTLMMITREGMETALLISTALFQLKSSAVLLGLGFGIIAAAAIAFAWTRLGRGVDIRGLLNVSSVFLLIFLVQLVLYGVHELSEARILPASQAVHDATEILGPDGIVGHILAYALAIVPTVWLGSLWLRRRASGHVADAGKAA